MLLGKTNHPLHTAAYLSVQMSSRSFWTASGSVLLVRQRASATRAFHGGMLPAVTRPDARIRGLRETRPVGTRVDWHTTTPCATARSSAASSAAVGRPAPVPADTIPRAPAAT